VLIVLEIEAEDPVAGAVVDGGVLETRGAGHFDFFDVYLDTVSRSLAAEARQLPWTPLRFPAEGRIPEPMDALELHAGADRPVLEVAAGMLNQRDG
jgi:hypothetical protein